MAKEGIQAAAGVFSDTLGDVRVVGTENDNTSSDEEVSELKRYLFKWLDSNKERNWLVVNADEDEILDKILTIFDGRVGS